LSYYSLGGLLATAIWAFCGGAITRKSVVQCGLEQSVSMRDALEFARKRWFAIFSAVTLPLVGIVMLAMPFTLLGWLMRLDIGIFVAGALWIFVLMVGGLMAVLCLGLLLGWPLMWGAISAENTDAFDAISRAYAYTFQRPLHYLMYVSTACMLGVMGWLLAWWFSEAVISLSYWSVEFGCGAERVTALRSYVNGEQPSGHLGSAMQSGTVLIRMTTGLTRCLASAFSFSFFWCNAGAIYLLLRHDTDQTELDDVIIDDAVEAA
jgi:hypothetical protein